MAGLLSAATAYDTLMFLPTPPPVTGRAELNAARQSQAVQARQYGPVSAAALARQLGYSDSRSVRRALRRWDSEAGGGG